MKALPSYHSSALGLLVQGEMDERMISRLFKQPFLLPLYSQRFSFSTTEATRSREHCISPLTRRSSARPSQISLLPGNTSSHSITPNLCFKLDDRANAEQLNSSTLSWVPKAALLVLFSSSTTLSLPLQESVVTGTCILASVAGKAQSCRLRSARRRRE